MGGGGERVRREGAVGWDVGEGGDGWEACFAHCMAACDGGGGWGRGSEALLHGEIEEHARGMGRSGDMAMGVEMVWRWL